MREIVVDFYWRIKSLHIKETIKIVVNRYLDSKRAPKTHQLPNYERDQSQQKSDIELQQGRDDRSLIRSTIEFCQILRHSASTAFSDWRPPNQDLYSYDSNFKIYRHDVVKYKNLKDKEFNLFVDKHFEKNFVFGPVDTSKKLSLFWKFTLYCGLIIFGFTFIRYYFKGQNDFRQVEALIQMQNIQKDKNKLSS